MTLNLPNPREIFIQNTLEALNSCLVSCSLNSSFYSIPFLNNFLQLYFYLKISCIFWNYNVLIYKRYYTIDKVRYCKVFFLHLFSIALQDSIDQLSMVGHPLAKVIKQYKNFMKVSGYKIVVEPCGLTHNYVIGSPDQKWFGNCGNKVQ